MQTFFYLLTRFILPGLFLLGCSSETTIKQPPYQISQSSYIHHDSIIQVPITINTEEIEKAILYEVQNPLSTGITDKITTDIFALQKITQRELVREYKDSLTNWFNPIEASYKYISEDITKAMDDSFKVGMWVEHEINLKDLSIEFEGSLIKIFSSYIIDVSADYEQSAVPFAKAVNLKGILDGKIEAEIHLEGRIILDDDAQLQIQARQDGTRVKFTKINLPSAINLLEILKVTKIEDYLTKRLLEEPVNRYIFHQIQEQISKKQINTQLIQKVEKLVYENSDPLAISEDLWLVPQAHKVSISQINTQDSSCKNTLSVNVGIFAQPKLITSSTKPSIPPKKSIPISCENLNDIIYLYPSVHVQYKFVEKVLEEKLNKLIEKEYPDHDYYVANINIYPSDTKLVVGMDLIEKSSFQKVVRFYLWGEPQVNTKEEYVELADLDYTLESKNYLIHTASWLLDAKIKQFIKENTHFNYQEKLKKLSQKLSNIEHLPNQKVLAGTIHSIKVKNILPAKDSLIVNTQATGQLSYEVKFYERRKEL